MICRVKDKSREQAAFENQLQEYAERDNANAGDGLGVAMLFVIAVPCWLLISYVVIRCMLWGAV